MNLDLRLAKKDDQELLFKWRNDGVARHESRHTGPIGWEEHKQWFDRALTSGESVIAIAELESVPVGTVRADLLPDDHVEISYTIASQFRGQGLSKPMVKKFVQMFLGEKKIVAHIKRGHIPSESVASALGLQPVSEERSEDPDDDRPMVEWR